MSQEFTNFAIPFLDIDLPFYVDPFLLWRSPSFSDKALHTALISSFNFFGLRLAARDFENARETIIRISECSEVGLGSAKNQAGHRIGAATTDKILSLFSEIPQIASGGLQHIEELQLLVDGIGPDRISDFTCSVLKYHLIDFTIESCNSVGLPLSQIEVNDVFDPIDQKFKTERVNLPLNPTNGKPVLLIPKRWLRRMPFINADDFVSKIDLTSQPAAVKSKPALLKYNRHNYNLVRSYIEEKERTFENCVNDPLFKPLPVFSAKKKWAEIKKLQTGKGDSADRKYENLTTELLASLLYPFLDYADFQSRTESGTQIRDAIFYNTLERPVLSELLDKFGSRQIIFELKNVEKVDKDHLNQINRYLADHFGRFGVIVTRHPLPKQIRKHTIDIWSGQRKCIVPITDEDLALMVDMFDTKQRKPIEVLERSYLQFMRECPQ